MDCECQLAECKLEVEMSGRNCPWKMSGEMFHGQIVSVKNIWGNCPRGGMSGGIVNGECQLECPDLRAGLQISCSGDDLLPPWLAQTHTDITASDQLYTASSAS